jgi:HSP20 family molecular chaperone IbpA
MDVQCKDTNEIVASFELPGLQKEDVSIDVHNNILTVSGQNNTSSERNEDGYVVRERRHGKFTRALSLPQGLKVSFHLVTCTINRGADAIAFTERGYQSVHGQRRFDH